VRAFLTVDEACLTVDEACLTVDEAFLRLPMPLETAAKFLVAGGAGWVPRLAKMLPGESGRICSGL
jgi:hypothetical protein